MEKSNLAFFSLMKSSENSAGSLQKLKLLALWSETWKYHQIYCLKLYITKNNIQFIFLICFFLVDGSCFFDYTLPIYSFQNKQFPNIIVLCQVRRSMESSLILSQGWLVKSKPSSSITSSSLHAGLGGVTPYN